MSLSSPSHRPGNGYAATPQHLKTLDVLGKTKSFAKLSLDDLRHYCELAQNKYNCSNAYEASLLFEDRYGWDVSLRSQDVEDAWRAAVEDAEEHQPADPPATQQLAQQSEIPVIIKSTAFSRPVMICEVDDDALHFTGDSGAVGRIFCEPTSLRLDLKGRQYSAQITSGPTLMVLNLAAPVGQSGSSSLCARAEVVTNEFVHLEFEKDLHGTMQGVYTGNDGEEALFDRGSDYGSDSNDKPKKGSKSKATTGGTDANPKISTITQRKRKSGGTKGAGSNSKKSGSATKKAKS